PTTMSTLCVATEIIHAVWQALNKVDPERSCAGWGKIIFPITSGRQKDGSLYVMYHWSAGVGVGAVKGRDGFNSNGSIVNLGAMHTPNVEGYEQSYPVHFQKVEFRTDAGGAGQYRGGTGIDYVVELEQPSALAIRGEGLWTPSGFGAFGGMYGAAGQMTLDPLEGEKLRKYEVRSIGPTRLSIQAAGGGGWGDSLARDPERVLRDVRDEVVSKEAAEHIYGVVIDDTGEVAAQKTKALRQQMAMSRKERDVIDEEPETRLAANAALQMITTLSIQ